MSRRLMRNIISMLMVVVMMFPAGVVGAEVLVSEDSVLETPVPQEVPEEAADMENELPKNDTDDSDSADKELEDTEQNEEIAAETEEQPEELIGDVPAEVNMQRFGIAAKVVKAGWIEHDAGLKYQYSDGTYAKAKWECIKNKWYYFDTKGWLLSGWQRIDGKDYYLKKTGAAGARGTMLSGWQTIGSKTYFFESSGALNANGWAKMSGSWYYFKKTGKAGARGAMLMGWQTLGGKVYYLKKSGAYGTRGKMLTGTHTIDGRVCYFDNSGAYVPAMAERVSNTKTAQKTNQIITAAGGKLTLWEKSGKEWKAVISNSCRFGRNGISANKQEGDGKTPAGAYTMSLAFGRGNNPGTKLPYRKITNNSYWISNTADQYYNTWQERKSSSGKDEHLIDYSVYKYAMVIDYNTQCTPGKGSAIFLHCSVSKNTAGCVSVPESTMLALMRRVDKGAYIIITDSEANISKY